MSFSGATPQVSAQRAVRAALPFLDVTDPRFGARGDGATDDTAAIQAAITAANASGGGRVVVPRGTYKVTSGLTLSANIALDLDPRATLDFSTAASNTTLLAAAGAIGTAVPLTVNALEGATSLSVEVGAEAGFEAGDMVFVRSDAIYDTGRTNTKLGEIAFIESVSSGAIALRAGLAGGPYTTADAAAVLKITPASNIALRGGKIVGVAGSAHVGLRVQYGHDVRVEGTRFEDVDSIACYFLASTDVVVHAISVLRSKRSASGYGVDFDDGSQDCVVSDGYFRQCRHAVTNGTSNFGYGIVRRITYANCKAFDATGDAFDTHAPAEDITFTGCTVHDVTGFGFNIECSRASIVACIVRRASSHGILFNNYSDAPTEYLAVGNKIQRCVDGIRYSNGAVAGRGATIASVVIDGNAVSGCTGVGIHLTSSDTWRIKNATVNGNAVDSAGSATAAIYVNKSDGVVLSGNIVSTVPANNIGIRLNDATKSVIAANSVLFASLGTGIGIYLLTAIDGVVSGNAVTLGGRGVFLDNNCTYCVIEANGVRGCTTPLTIGTGTGHVVSGNVHEQSASVASAGTLTLPRHADVITVTGTTTITSITADRAGRIVVLVFPGALTVTDGSNLKLAGNFVTTADDTLMLASDGTNWIEVGGRVAA